MSNFLFYSFNKYKAFILWYNLSEIITEQYDISIKHN